MAKAAKQLDKMALKAEEVVEGLKTVYKKAVRPLEKDFKYDVFYDAPLLDVDFDSKPMVLILGQYSVGKTSFIKHLIGRDFPGMNVGPEPTTDRFSCIYYGKEDGQVPGSVLQMNPDLPFREVGQFGAHFLNKFQGASCSSNALKSFMFIDTPGVLSGKKQINRQYPFQEVTQWFANKAARILILFDCNKLDINDEFKAVIRRLRKHDDKIRIVLNKADTIPPKELIRVYGALMWSLGKVFDTPEVLKVYISSFHDRPFDRDNFMYSVFKGDGAKLVGELKALPRQQAMHKVNETLKRMRLVKVHTQIMSDLRQRLPKYFGKKKSQRRIVESLPEQFTRIATKIGVPPADFPSLKKFKAVLAKQDLSKFPRPSQRKMKSLTYAMEVTVPSLVKRLVDKVNDEADEGEFENPFDPDEDVEDVSTIGSDDDLPGLAIEDFDKKMLEIDMRGSVYDETVYENASARNSGYNANRQSRNSRVSRSSYAQRRLPQVPVSVTGVTAQSLGGGGGHMDRLQHMSGQRVPSLREDDNRSFYDYQSGGVGRASMPRRNSDVSSEWVVNMTDKIESDNIFYQQQLVNGKLSRNAARKAFKSLGVREGVSFKIWKLVNFNKDNQLDADQFALAFWLAKQYRAGTPVPKKLTYGMVPPSYKET